MKSVIAAFQFLTVLPLPIKTRQEHMARSIMWFPLVGAFIGLLLYLMGQGLHYIFPRRIGAALIVFLYIILTRGLHLDGYMDTVDGFFSSRDRESILRIMKEPAVGSFAVLAVGVWFLVFFSAVPCLRALDFVVVHTISRMSILLIPLFFSYPREGGKGLFFFQHMRTWTFLGAITVTGFILSVVAYVVAYPVTRFPLYVALLVLAFLVAVFIGRWSGRKIGGVTGDVLGFTVETVNMILLLALSFKFK